MSDVSGVLKKISYLAAMICCLLLVSESHASQSEIDTFLESVQEKADSVNAFTSNIHQEKHLSLFDQKVIFTGRIAVVKPDKLRWEFFAPVPYALLLDGSAGLKCDENMKGSPFSLKSDPVMAEVAAQLWRWLGGDYTNLKEVYSISIPRKNELELIPLAEQTAKFIVKVTILFDPASYQPKRVTITESGEDFTVINFIDPQDNPSLDHSLFTACK